MSGYSYFKGIRVVSRCGVRFNGEFYHVPFAPGRLVEVTRNSTVLRITLLGADAPYSLEREVV